MKNAYVHSQKIVKTDVRQVALTIAELSHDSLEQLEESWAANPHFVPVRLGHNQAQFAHGKYSPQAYLPQGQFDVIPASARDWDFSGVKYAPPLIHDSLVVCGGACSVGEYLLEWGRLLGDGGFARVVALDAKRVLKATCCSATITLLDDMFAVKQPVPGLPMVAKKLGVIAQDADDMQYTGYVMERLRPPRNGFEEAMLGDMVDYFGERMAEVDNPETNSEESIRLADEFAATNVFGLGLAFEKIAKSLRQSRGVLDLVMPNNILFDQNGKLCLADPVAPCFELA